MIAQPIFNRIVGQAIRLGQVDCAVLRRASQQIF
jgi:hypothetical protein